MKQFSFCALVATFLFSANLAYCDFPPGAYSLANVAEEDGEDCCEDDCCCDYSSVDADGYWYEDDDLTSWPGRHEDTWYDQLTR